MISSIPWSNCKHWTASEQQRSPVLLVWTLAEFLKRRKRRHQEAAAAGQRRRHGLVAARGSQYSCILQRFHQLSHIGFGSWVLEAASRLPGLVFESASWLLSTLLLLYFKHEDAAGVVLPIESVLATLHLLRLFDSATVNRRFASLPFCTVICLVVVAMSLSKANQKELDQPLLPREDADDSSRDRFSSSGWWSRLTFAGVRLELEHIPSVPQSETAEQSYALLQETLHKQKPGRCHCEAIICAVWTPLVTNAVFAGLNTFSSYMGPFLITYLVELLSDKNTEKGHGHGYMLACLFFASKTVESLSQRQWYFGAQRWIQVSGAALMVSIYKKSLLMKNSSTVAGKVVNFLDVDVEKVGEFFWYIHGIWLLPLQIFLALAILYHSLGAMASLSAVLVTVLVMVSNTPLANSQQNLNMKIMEAKDSRIKAMAEAMKSMRILKLHAWETAYLDKLLKLRDVERGWLRKYLYTCSAIAFLFWASPTLVSVVTFGVCILVEIPLSAGTVLSALATFRILQDPIYNLPELVSMVTQTKVSLDRIEEFIKEDYQGKPSFYGNITGTKDLAMTGEIVIEPGEYSWEADNSSKKTKVTLKINSKVSIGKGLKVAVCGPVGSGKSSLLYSIMGEIPRVSGAEPTVVGSRAYVPQSAWIQTGTIQDNVLFGKAMDRSLYEEVLQGCALDRDLELWANRNMTEVGERDVNLSGGQKQRIQLARALYSDSDVYFLDDPFSAVDAHTSAHLFKECLLRLMSSKTVMYVTHQLEFLRDSDLVLVMSDGRIVQSGKYDDLIADKMEALRQMAAHDQSLVRRRESGRVKWDVYRKFVTSAYGGGLIPVVLLCQIFFQGLQICSNYWIAWAAEREDQVSKKKMIGIFVLLSAGSSVFILGRAVFLSTIAIKTAQQLFLGMIRNIFRAPMSFFDSTPSSRILNRVSQQPYLSTREIVQDTLSTVEWLCIRINFLFNLVFFVMLVILVSLPRDTIDPSLAGLAATYGLNLNVLQAWVIWNLCNVENKMISVERIFQFTNMHPDMPMVLKGMNCTFPGEKKIGVVGRTGSGKSTLIQALFRVVEPSAGRIFIDGVDISLLGVHDLRCRLSIIPQEPTLFQGTVRTNLDPLQQHLDTEIWEVLRKCRLEEIVREDNRLLDAPVWGRGNLCSRVLLMKRKILVLDEATASAKADNCTVITIAHRIPTVIDSDLVLVLGEGRILEFDSPGNLLRDESSAFSKLVMEFMGRSEGRHQPELMQRHQVITNLADLT
ncbi:hypothetical protein ZWY2020_057838 [Hordeum vulgare]|nr:hypothetical protein ZWY2020_057838 [Hordeum vulgare]